MLWDSDGNGDRIESKVNNDWSYAFNLYHLRPIRQSEDNGPNLNMFPLWAYNRYLDLRLFAASILTTSTTWPTPDLSRLNQSEACGWRIRKHASWAMVNLMTKYRDLRVHEIRRLRTSSLNTTMRQGRTPAKLSRKYFIIYYSQYRSRVFKKKHLRVKDWSTKCRDLQ